MIKEEKREPIRDNSSNKKVKPRVMDYVRRINGEEVLEVKDGNMKKTILLSDFSRQLKTLRHCT